MQLNRLPIAKVQVYADELIFTLLPLLLEDQIQHRVRDMFVNLWESIYTLAPFEYAIKTINAISASKPSHIANTHNLNKHRRYLPLCVIAELAKTYDV